MLSLVFIGAFISTLCVLGRTRLGLTSDLQHHWSVAAAKEEIHEDITRICAPFFTAGDYFLDPEIRDLAF